jgi:hypothetical protein
MYEEKRELRERKEEMLWKIRRMWILRRKFGAGPPDGSEESIELELEQLHNDMMGYDIMGMLIDEIPLFKGAVG